MNKKVLGEELRYKQFTRDTVLSRKHLLKSHGFDSPTAVSPRQSETKKGVQLTSGDQIQYKSILQNELLELCLSQDGEKTSNKGKIEARGAQVQVQDELDQEWGGTSCVLLGLVLRKQLLHLSGMQRKGVDAKSYYLSWQIPRLARDRLPGPHHLPLPNQEPGCQT